MIEQFQQVLALPVGQLLVLFLILSVFFNALLIATAFALRAERDDVWRHPGTNDNEPDSRERLSIVELPEPTTLRELAQRSVDNARSRLECAQVEYEGATQRLRIIEQSSNPDRALCGVER